jgi:hypothetical protein
MERPNDSGEWMELGGTNWVPLPDGTFINNKEGLIRDENGNVYGLDGVDIDNDTSFFEDN